MPSRVAWFFGIVVLVLVAAFGWRSDNQHLLTVAIQTMILAILACSWNILAGFAGQISLGHAAFFGLGSLVTRELWLGGSSLAAAIAIALLVTMLAAAVVGVPMLRFREIYFAIGTLALGVAVFLTIGNIRPGITSLPAGELRSYDFTPRFFLTLGILVGAVLISIWLRRSKVGLGMMAIRDDEGAASATGVNPLTHKMAAFVLSAGLAGLAGSAFAYFTPSYYPSAPFNVLWTFEAVLVVFIGGLGTIVGPVVGSVFFIVGRDLLPADIGGLHVLIFGVLFIVVVLLMPGGLAEAAGRFFKWVTKRFTRVPEETENNRKELV